MTYSDNYEHFLFHIFASLAGRIIRQEKQIKVKRLEGRKKTELEYRTMTFTLFDTSIKM